MTELNLNDKSLITLNSMIEYFSQPVRPKSYYSADVFIFNSRGYRVASDIDDLLYHVHYLRHHRDSEEFAEEVYHLWGLISIVGVGSFRCDYDGNCSSPWVYRTDKDSDIQDYQDFQLLYSDVVELMADLASDVQQGAREPRVYRELMSVREKIASEMDEYIY